jgi:hypothetical protein
VLVAVLAGLACGSAARAQTIDGHLRVAGSGAPLAGAFVILRDADGREVARTLTDAEGRFTFEAAPGRYQVQTARIGWRPWFSPPLDVPPDGVLRYTGEVDVRAVGLSAIVVRGERVCETDPGAGREIAQVWDEARKALDAVAWTRRSIPLTFELAWWERRLHANTLEVLSQEDSSWSARASGSPFASAPAAALSAHGYIVENDDHDWEFFGPDADVLLSPEFAADHCFYLKEREDDRRLLGLAFEPVPHRLASDIHGVLWLDRETAQLEALEFEYANLPWVIPDESRLGGHVEFVRLETGGWVVSSWWLRMPILTITTRRVNGHKVAGYGVAALSEVGGRVGRVSLPDGNVVKAVSHTP